MADVLFKEGTNTQYSSITPDNNTFYKVQDSNSDDPDVYLGSVDLSNKIDFAISGTTLNITTKKK